jgi:hypothetical protein
VNRPGDLAVTPALPVGLGDRGNRGIGDTILIVFSNPEMSLNEGGSESSASYRATIDNAIAGSDGAATIRARGLAGWHHVYGDTTP